MSALQRVVEQHMVPDRRSARALRIPWWDSDVEEAWKRRREANREHRSMVQSSDTEACPVTWQRYLELKHAVQAKIPEYNKQIFHSLLEDGMKAAEKLWQYAREKLADELSSILAGTEIAKDWRQGRLTLILKQGGAADLLQSYRPIMVYSVM
ncbi:hypothetical protein HPB50_024126 [Hyalomma asiaticum]|uniref:Uncharacterized protein n=1 Tax=Hyalomma asiaticum TaxID=266040 RepID=A0ACB7SHE8_HYAAI|nr:hypothetical protein HPB50_024126 [Hyalomma asiaticum]